MGKIISLFLLLLPFCLLSAQELFYEHYANEVAMWVVFPYNSINFKKGSDAALYQVSLQISDAKKKQVATLEKSQIIPKRDWLSDCGIPMRFQQELPQGSYNIILQIKKQSNGR